LTEGRSTPVRLYLLYQHLGSPSRRPPLNWYTIFHNTSNGISLTLVPPMCRLLRMRFHTIGGNCCIRIHYRRRCGGAVTTYGKATPFPSLPYTCVLKPISWLRPNMFSCRTPPSYARRLPFDVFLFLILRLRRLHLQLRAETIEYIIY
jgi:hypothetical protein